MWPPVLACSVFSAEPRASNTPALLGRVSSAHRVLGWGLLPLGALAGGLVASRLGLRAPLPLAGALRAVALVGAAPVLWRELARGPGEPRAAGG